MSNLENPTANNPELASLQSLLKILEEINKKFKDLKIEADEALHKHMDAETYKQKLTERADLILNLPKSLAGTLENLDEELRKKVEREIDNIVYLAEQRKKSGKIISLDGLINSRGYDKNALEELIDNIKEKNL